MLAKKKPYFMESVLWMWFFSEKCYLDVLG
jgi:hypothetical protein